jgi:ABC-type branched-subunit amino acid transport system substrate-binding protein
MAINPQLKQRWQEPQRPQDRLGSSTGVGVAPDEPNPSTVWKKGGTEAALGEWRSWSQQLLMPTVLAALLVGSAVIGWLFLNRQGQAPSSAELAGKAAADSRQPLRFGMSAAFSGPAKELGQGMRVGIETCFRHLNDSEQGINGHRLDLVALDDGYEPVRCLENAHDLIEQHKVFGMVGNVGTPTTQAALPYVLENKTLFFGAFTGAGLLRRQPPERWVFNYRASYSEETQTIVHYLVNKRGLRPEEIAVFAQNDSYGDAGWSGVVKSIARYKGDPTKILRVGYERNTMDVADAVDRIVRAKDTIRAIVMVPTYRQAALFIKQLKDQNVNPIFASVSFVGSSALAAELKQLGPQYGNGVIVTQVVPHYNSNQPGVVQYRKYLEQYFPKEQPSFTSLEGYLAASLLAEGLRRAGPNPTTEKVIEALESVQNFDLGIGTGLSFGRQEHQGTHNVWGTLLNEMGEFQSLDME